MTIQRFDPFEDRLCRDIRNDLSESLMETLAQLSLKPVQEKADEYLSRDLAPVYTEYIRTRLAHYQKAIEIIKDRQIEDNFARALVLWDLELFFEVHELLEGEWMAAAGAEKQVLQAMIRAAGVYVQLDRGNTIGANKMAAKAVEVFIEHRQVVPAIFDLDVLLEKLKEVDPIPPKLIQ